MQDDRFGMLAIHAHNFLRGPSGLWHTLAESSPAWKSDATGRRGPATTSWSRPWNRPAAARTPARLREIGSAHGREKGGASVVMTVAGEYFKYKIDYIHVRSIG